MLEQSGLCLSLFLAQLSIVFFSLLSNLAAPVFLASATFTGGSTMIIN